jgi:heat shock protein HslJ
MRVIMLRSRVRSGVLLAALGLVAALALTACDDSEPRVDTLGLAQAPADLSELAGGVWVADDIQDPDVSLVPGSQIEMRFQSDSLSANAGCNTLLGGASIDGDELVAPALASTKKACEADLTRQDAWLTDFLGSRPSIEVLDHDLWLYHGDDTVIHLVQQ